MQHPASYILLFKILLLSWVQSQVSIPPEKSPWIVQALTDLTETEYVEMPEASGDTALLCIRGI